MNELILIRDEVKEMEAYLAQQVADVHRRPFSVGGRRLYEQQEQSTDDWWDYVW